MLVKFAVSNYKNFAKEITMDFSATRDYKFNEACIKNGILNKVIIYGPNSSGKTNLGFALFDIVGLLTDKNIRPEMKLASTYLNADSVKKEAVFKYDFQFGEDQVHLEYGKSSPNEETFETFVLNGVEIYYYVYNNDFSNGFDTEKMALIGADSLNFSYFEKNFSVLRYIANNTPQSKDSIVTKVMDFVSGMLWFRSLQDNSYIGLTSGRESLEDYLINNNLVGEFGKFLYDIAGIRAELEVAESAAFNDSKVIVEKHENGSLPFQFVASSGTKALELFYYWSKRFDQVTFLFMDEFDAFYHYDLSRRIIRYLIDLKQFQTVFTTHNSYLASNEVVRPDCCFTLNVGTLKSFADSTPRELREGHNLEKLLRNGEFDHEE